MKRFPLSLLTILFCSLTLTGCLFGDEDASAECTTYCDAVMKNCSGDNALFATRNECEDTCKQYPQGDEDDRKGDSVQCRIYHASAPAKGDPATHCPHASPDGGGMCTDEIPPTRCEQYCSQMDEQCSEIFADIAACQEACRTFAPGTQGETTNNTLECRMSFLFTPDNSKSPAQICTDASPNSMVCVSMMVDGDQ